MPESIVIAPTPQIVHACDALDKVIAAFIRYRSEVPGTEFESNSEALILFNLVIRQVEGVLELARKDLALVPAAYACARSALETAIKAAWLVNLDDPFAREARWLAHIAEEERVYRRAVAKSEHNQLTQRFQDQAEELKVFREAVARKMPSGVVIPSIANAEEMISAIGGRHLYSIYIFLSQFVHGGHLATTLYRKNLGIDKEYGEFVELSHWYIALRACWLSLSQPGDIVLDRVAGKSSGFYEENAVKAAVAAIEAARIGEPTLQ